MKDQEKLDKKAGLVAKMDALREIIQDLEDQVSQCDKVVSDVLLSKGNKRRLHNLITEVGIFAGNKDDGGELVGKNRDEITSFMRGLTDESLALAGMLMQAKLREVGVWLASREYLDAEKELDEIG